MFRAHAGRILFFSWILGAFLGQAVNTTVPSIPRPTKEQIDLVGKQLDSNDAVLNEAALSQIKEWAVTGRFVSELGDRWLARLMTLKKHEDAAELSLGAVLSSPTVSNVRVYMPFRSQALAELKRDQQALQATKSFYNAADSRALSSAIACVTICLRKVYPDDPTLVPRFRAEQTESSVVTPGARLLDPPKAGNTILQSIKIDASIYEKALDSWKVKSTENARNKEMYANVLLLADRGEEAEKLFREIGAATGNRAQDRQKFVEGVARALRAQDGNLARANAWTREQQAAATQRTADPALP